MENNLSAVEITQRQRRIHELEDKALTPLERAIRDYGDELHGCTLEDMDLDSDAKYLLVTENVQGGYWLTTWDDRDDAFAYSNDDGTEYAHEWMFERLIDLETGKSYYPKAITVTEWVEQ